MNLSYFLRFFCPSLLYAYFTRVRLPASIVDFRKILIAKHLLKEGDTAIDGGAHIGYYTRCFSDIVGGNGKVWSFEPNPYMFRLLRKYVRYKSNISAFAKALSSQSFLKVAFHLTPYSLREDSTLVEGQIQKGQKKIEVETVRIDDFFNDLFSLKLIKLDVEGHEAAVMEGARRVIQQFRPWIIFEYVHTPKRKDSEALSFLEKNNYFCFDLETLTPIDPDKTIDTTDLIAFPKESGLSAIPFLQSLSFY